MSDESFLVFEADFISVVCSEPFYVEFDYNVDILFSVKSGSSQPKFIFVKSQVLYNYNIDISNLFCCWLVRVSLFIDLGFP